MMIPAEIVLKGSVTESYSIRGSVSESYSGKADTAVIVREVRMPTYDGPYQATPGEEAQVIPTALHSMAQDFVVNAIPANYGRLIWDGSVLTVY